MRECREEREAYDLFRPELKAMTVSLFVPAHTALSLHHIPLSLHHSHLSLHHSPLSLHPSVTISVTLTHSLMAPISAFCGVLYLSHSNITFQLVSVYFRPEHTHTLSFSLALVSVICFGCLGAFFLSPSCSATVSG